jgi:hypothetical protein
MTPSLSDSGMAPGSGDQLSQNRSPLADDRVFVPHRAGWLLVRAKCPPILKKSPPPYEVMPLSRTVGTIVSASRGPKAISVATTRDNENALAFRVFAG